MRVMEHYVFFDEDVEQIRMEGHNDVREVILKDTNEGALLITKEDVIALAGEFDLAVYAKGSEL